MEINSLYGVPIKEKPLKLDGDWYVELDQKLQEYYGNKFIYWEYRCYKNARRVKKWRRKKYWVRQAQKYNRRG